MAPQKSLDQDIMDLIVVVFVIGFIASVVMLLAGAASHLAIF